MMFGVSFVGFGPGVLLVSLTNSKKGANSKKKDGPFSYNAPDLTCVGESATISAPHERSRGFVREAGERGRSFLCRGAVWGEEGTLMATGTCVIPLPSGFTIAMCPYLRAFGDSEFGRDQVCDD